MPPFSARTVVESSTVEEDIGIASREYSRCAEVWEAMKWDLARAPQEGAVNLDDHWMKKSAPWAVEGVPQITALYTFDANTVDVIAVRVSKPDES